MVSAQKNYPYAALRSLYSLGCYSSNVSRVQYQAISTQPGMDIWSIKDDSIDVRISRESEMSLRQMGVDCTIVHESVELLVQQFEQKLTMQQQEWFEEYVSCVAIFCILHVSVTSCFHRLQPSDRSLVGQNIKYRYFRIKSLRHLS